MADYVVSSDGEIPNPAIDDGMAGSQLFGLGDGLTYKWEFCAIIFGDGVVWIVQPVFGLCTFAMTATHMTACVQCVSLLV